MDSKGTEPDTGGMDQGAERAGGWPGDGQHADDAKKPGAAGKR